MTTPILVKDVMYTHTHTVDSNFGKLGHSAKEKTQQCQTHPSSLSARVDFDNFISALAYCSSIAALGAGEKDGIAYSGMC